MPGILSTYFSNPFLMAPSAPVIIIIIIIMAVVHIWMPD